MSRRRLHAGAGPDRRPPYASGSPALLQDVAATATWLAVGPARLWASMR